VRVLKAPKVFFPGREVLLLWLYDFAAISASSPNPFQRCATNHVGVTNNVEAATEEVAAMWWMEPVGSRGGSQGEAVATLTLT
jgi:hypothetical protein